MHRGLRDRGGLNTFLVTTLFHMCYFIVLMSSLLFYNVEHSKVKNKEKPFECVVSKRVTGSVCEREGVWGLWDSFISLSR
jgi:hypothetical protein